VRVDAIHANGSSLAGLRGAIVDVDLAVAACVAGDARAGIAARRVGAGTVVQAGLLGARVEVRLAVRAAPVGSAGARVTGDAVDARTTVLTSGGCAIVDVHVARRS